MLARTRKAKKILSVGQNVRIGIPDVDRARTQQKKCYRSDIGGESGAIFFLQLPVLLVALSRHAFYCYIFNFLFR